MLRRQKEKVPALSSILNCQVSLMTSEAEGVSDYSACEKTIRQHVEPIWLGMRVYRGLILNLLGSKVPFFCSHKLTYNCSLAMPQQTF